MSALFSKKNKAFTLIELLVVVAIIGILATLIFPNLVGFFQRGRDAKRKSDLRQIQAALELYKADQGIYQVTSGTDYNIFNTATNCYGKRPFLYGSTTYIQKTPCDPLSSTTFNGNSDHYYYYSQDGSDYTLVACLENKNDGDPESISTRPNPDPDGGVATCPSSQYYTLTNP